MDDNEKKEDFLAPLPVKPRGRRGKHKAGDSDATFTVPDWIPNPMDVSVRKEFTNVLNFRDFNSMKHENALYGPA